MKTSLKRPNVDEKIKRPNTKNTTTNIRITKFGIQRSAKAATTTPQPPACQPMMERSYCPVATVCRCRCAIVACQGLVQHLAVEMRRQQR
jgi:hypothetical protein